MRALEVSYDGKVLATAGTPHTILLSFGIVWPVDEKWPWIDIGGMDAYPDKRTSHLQWIAPLALRPPGTVVVRLVDTDAPTSPMEERYVDSEASRADQAGFESTLTGPRPPPPPMERMAPHAAMVLHLPGRDAMAATLDDGRDYLFFRCTWHMRDQCRISLRGNAMEEIQARRGGRDWFLGTLRLGEDCRIEVGSQA